MADRTTTALLVSTDLMAISAFDGAALRAGVEAVAAGPADAPQAAAASRPGLVFLDLTAKVDDLTALVTELKAASPDTRVLAYGPHVHEQKLVAAKLAGSDGVLSRGQFHGQMGALLAQLADASSAD